MVIRAAKNLIGPQVRRYRARKRWSQQTLAAKLQLRGWSISRDLRIAKLIQVTNGRTDLEEAIRGLRVLYPTGKLTLKLIASQKSRLGVQLYNRAVQAYRQQSKRRPSTGLGKLGITVSRPAA